MLVYQADFSADFQDQNDQVQVSFRHLTVAQSSRRLITRKFEVLWTQLIKHESHILSFCYCTLSKMFSNMIHANWKHVYPNVPIKTMPETYWHQFWSVASTNWKLWREEHDEWDYDFRSCDWTDGSIKLKILHGSKRRVHVPYAKHWEIRGTTLSWLIEFTNTLSRLKLLKLIDSSCLFSLSYGQPQVET